jgi:hypothetical protein
MLVISVPTKMQLPLLDTLNLKKDNGFNLFSVKRGGTSTGLSLFLDKCSRSMEPEISEALLRDQF